MKKIDTDCEPDDRGIPPLCLKTFLTIKMLWIITMAIILPASGAVITWAFANGNEQVKQNDKIAAIEEKQHELETQINGKLDELIKRGHERRE